MTTYYTYKKSVPLLPGQTLGYKPGHGYYAKGAPTPTRATRNTTAHRTQTQPVPAAALPPERVPHGVPGGAGVNPAQPTPVHPPAAAPPPERVPHGRPGGAGVSPVQPRSATGSWASSGRVSGLSSPVVRIAPPHLLVARVPSRKTTTGELRRPAKVRGDLPPPALRNGYVAPGVHLQVDFPSNSVGVSTVREVTLRQIRDLANPSWLPSNIVRTLISLPGTVERKVEGLIHAGEQFYAHPSASAARFVKHELPKTEDKLVHKAMDKTNEVIKDEFTKGLAIFVGEKEAQAIIESAGFLEEALALYQAMVVAQAAMKFLNDYKSSPAVKHPNRVTFFLNVYTGVKGPTTKNPQGLAMPSLSPSPPVGRSLGGPSAGEQPSTAGPHIDVVARASASSKSATPSPSLGKLPPGRYEPDDQAYVYFRAKQVGVQPRRSPAPQAPTPFTL